MDWAFKIMWFLIILTILAPTRGLDISSYMNPGFTAENNLPDILATEKVNKLQGTFQVIWKLFTLFYLFGSIIILKIKYVYPTVEDVCAIYAQKKMYFARAMMYKIYNHIELFALMLISVFKSGAQIGVYSLFGAEYFNYCIVVGITFFITRDRQSISKCLLFRDFVFTLLGLYCFYKYILTDSSFVWCFLTWMNYLCYYIADVKNEYFMSLFFKAICLIEEDESFECAPLTKMRKRRFSSENLKENVEEIKKSKELNNAIKRQNMLYSFSNYNDDTKKVENHKKFSRLVLMISFLIKDKIEQAKLIRDEKYQETVGVMEDSVFNVVELSSDNGDEDEMSMDLEDFAKLTPRQRRKATKKFSKRSNSPIKEQPEKESSSRKSNQRSSKKSQGSSKSGKRKGTKKVSGMSAALNDEELSKLSKPRKVRSSYISGKSSSKYSRNSSMSNYSDDSLTQGRSMTFKRHDSGNSQGDDDLIDFKSTSQRSKFAMPDGCMASFVFILFLPTYFLFWLTMPDIKRKPDLSKVLLASILIFIFSFTLGYFIYDLQVDIVLTWGIKAEIVGIFNGGVLSLGFLAYGSSIASIEYNYFLTSQEFTIFKYTFLVGFGWLLNSFLKFPISFRNNNFNFILSISLIVAIQLIGILYSLLSCFRWCWQFGIINFLMYFGILYLVYTF